MDDKEFAIVIGILILLIEIGHFTLHHHDLMVVGCLSNSMLYSLK